MALPVETNKLLIYRNDLQAGVLYRTDTGCSFEFSEQFLAAPRYEGLSFCMKKAFRTLTVSGNNLHPFFAGLLPEGKRLNALRSVLKTSADDMFSLFAAAGTNVIGDVHSATSEHASPLPGSPPALKKIDFYEYFSTLLATNSYANGEDSLAGVQEKISGSMISFPLNIASAKNSFILKLNPADRHNLVCNELHSMELAQKCGLKVAKVKLIHDRNRNQGLLVQRFDREYNETSKRIMMHHQEDACQFLDKYPADKYRISLNEIAVGIRNLSSAPEIMILKLLQLYCFSYLLCNGDLHAKNISLITRAQSSMVELTPAYDLICTLIYGDQTMALKIDGRNDNIRRATILHFAKRFGVPEAATHQMLDKLLQNFCKNRNILEKIPMTDKQRSFLQKTMEKRTRDLV